MQVPVERPSDIELWSPDKKRRVERIDDGVMVRQETKEGGEMWMVLKPCDKTMENMDMLRTVSVVRGYVGV